MGCGKNGQNILMMMMMIKLENKYYCVSSALICCFEKICSFHIDVSNKLNIMQDKYEFVKCRVLRNILIFICRHSRNPQSTYILFLVSYRTGK